MIKATFNAGKNKTTAKGLWKYNYGQELQIEGLQLPSTVQVHFVAQCDMEAVPMVGTTANGITKVQIPDSLLRKENCGAWDYDIYAYVYVTDATSGQTVYMITLPVEYRAKPGSTTPPQDDPNAFDKAVNAVKGYTEKAKASADTATSVANELKGSTAQIAQNTEEISQVKGDLDDYKNEISESTSYAVFVDLIPIETQEGKSAYINGVNTIVYNSNTKDTCVKVKLPNNVNSVWYQGDCIGGNEFNKSIIFADANNTPTGSASATDNTNWTILTKPVEIPVPSGSVYAYVNFRYMSTNVSTIQYKDILYSYKVGKNNLAEDLKNEITASTNKCSIFENVIPTKTKPTILFAFDAPNYDNRAEILEQYGFRGTFNYTMEFPTSSHGDFVKLIQHGHDIGIYRGGSIDDEPTTKVSDGWEEYIGTGIQWLAERGNYYLPTVYGCHSHKASQQILDACKKYNIPYVSAITYYTSETEYTIYSVKDNTPYSTVLRPITMPTLTLDAIKESIDYCVNNGTVLPLFTHYANASSDDGTSITESKFIEIVEYVKSLYDEGKVDILTYRELYNKYHQEDGKNRDYNRVMAGMISNKVW